jgi:hypothetical protein
MRTGEGSQTGSVVAPSGGGGLFDLPPTRSGGGGGRPPTRPRYTGRAHARMDEEPITPAERPNWLQNLASMMMDRYPLLGLGATAAQMTAAQPSLPGQFLASAAGQPQLAERIGEGAARGEARQEEYMRGLRSRLVGGTQPGGTSYKAPGVRGGMGGGVTPGAKLTPAQIQEVNIRNAWEGSRHRAGPSSLASGFYEWTNPETGEVELVPIAEDIQNVFEAIGGEPNPEGVMPDTYFGQLARWRQMMNSALGITNTILPDTWFAQQDRLLEQYYGANPYEELPVQGGNWWGGYGGGGGGGGGGKYNPAFWLNRVKWNI